MAKTGWERFPGPEDQDEGYYHEPLGFRTDQDAGAAVNIAIRRERDQVVAFLRRKANSQSFGHGFFSASELADEIEKGEHYAQAEKPSDAYYAANFRNA